MQNLSVGATYARLEHFPAAFFAMVMGLTGLTLAWQQAARIVDAPLLISQLLLWFSVLVFVLIAATYGYKLVRHRQAVMDEFHHPIKMSFFPAFSISLILMSVATMAVSMSLSKILWMLGCVLHLCFTLYVLGQWLHHPRFEVAHSTPAWFIPVVGNILVPIAGVGHGQLEVSWFFFSIGLVYWIILKTLIFNRLFFHDPLPQKLLPTLFILIAPPAVGFISYIKLNGGLDNFARILFYAALFLLLLLLSQLPKFTKIGFFMSWWAYSFPLAASTVASLLMLELQPSAFMHNLATLLLIVTSGVILMLLIRTLRAVWRGDIFQPD
ncbi:C4-dicarboxylate ABC transporter [Motiliproteus coralliicola]|uniref:C4-dicarboxylate ABC transporter n=1 Tax=Motiliproteus coralliicola TaxID=2283196 RepID=A0A369WYV9_9GAMM|nr:SLAC1 anion channel family protein [Motiliproteus coralliicola]RDE24695.1 C4-dicarboxylate ABC transporter [Motiliproteus coralliicola]